MKISINLFISLLCVSCMQHAAPDAGKVGLTVKGDMGADGGTQHVWGAVFENDGTVSFSVWAPNAQQAWLEIEGANRISLSIRSGGAFEGRAQVSVGQRYRYVFGTTAGEIVRTDPYCRQVSTDSWCVLNDPKSYVWKSSSFKRPLRTTAVVYEMHVGTFGTFEEASARWPAIADLGVNVVELLPVNAFGSGPHGWGYNPQLYFAPKMAYGTPDALKTFIDQAHQREIAVWHDVVFNHMDGWRQAPLACFDGTCSEKSWGIYYFGEGPYALTPWGPRPNYVEPRVSGMLLDSAKQWLEEYRGDGFRVDSVSNIRAIDGVGTTPGGRDFLVRLNALARQYQALSIAEDLKGYDALTESSSSGGFGFDAQWDGFGYDIANLIVPAADDGRDLGIVERALKGAPRDPFARLLWTENHDTVGNDGARLPVRIDVANPESFAARRRTMIATALLMTTPGIPMLFMGQEYLSTAPFKDPALPLPPPTARGEEVRAYFKDFIALRRTLAGLQSREVQILHRHDVNKVIAYRRGATVVVINFRNKPYTRYDIGVPTAGNWSVKIDNDWVKYGSDFGGGNGEAATTINAPRDNQPHTLPIKLPAYGVVVLSQ